MRLVIFDGLCNFCDGSVRWMIAHDRNGRLKFAASQTEQAQAILKARGIDPGAPGSIVFIHDGTAYRKSTAASLIAAELDPPWNALRLLRHIPQPLRDFGYDIVAAIRYRLAGRKASCRIPSEAERARFL